MSVKLICASANANSWKRFRNNRCCAMGVPCCVSTANAPECDSPSRSHSSRLNDASGVADGVAETAYAGVTGAFPTLVLIDRDFNVQYLEGGLDLPGVTARIEALLKP